MLHLLDTTVRLITGEDVSGGQHRVATAVKDAHNLRVLLLLHTHTIQAVPHNPRASHTLTLYSRMRSTAF